MHVGVEEEEAEAKAGRTTWKDWRGRQNLVLYVRQGLTTYMKQCGESEAPFQLDKMRGTTFSDDRKHGQHLQPLTP
jgi:hypothetical protein